MHLAEIRRILQQLKPELCQKYFVQTIGLFGSSVRDDFFASSDVDILVDFNQPIVNTRPDACWLK
ncbi:MAG: nucleotidyltransferase domain-containing protein [Chitinophagaceae bacterium]